jgi:antitoxin HicB
MPKKDLNYYQSLPYRMELFFDADDRTWFVRFPELPGCDADGDTPEHALAAGEEAKALWLADAHERKQPIPEPQPEVSHSGKFVLRLPKTLHAAAARTAQREGVSLNTYLTQLVAEGVQRSGFENLVVRRRVNSGTR